MICHIILIYEREASFTKLSRANVKGTVSWWSYTVIAYPVCVPNRYEWCFLSVVLCQSFKRRCVPVEDSLARFLSAGRTRISE